VLFSGTGVGLAQQSLLSMDYMGQRKTGRGNGRNGEKLQD
jgi:hypothetical protein